MATQQDRKKELTSRQRMNLENEAIQLHLQLLSTCKAPLDKIQRDLQLLVESNQELKGSQQRLSKHLDQIEDEQSTSQSPGRYPYSIKPTDGPRYDETWDRDQEYYTDQEDRRYDSRDSYYTPNQFIYRSESSRDQSYGYGEKYSYVDAQPYEKEYEEKSPGKYISRSPYYATPYEGQFSYQATPPSYYQWRGCPQEHLPSMQRISSPKPKQISLEESDAERDQFWAKMKANLAEISAENKRQMAELMNRMIPKETISQTVANTKSKIESLWAANPKQAEPVYTAKEAGRKFKSPCEELKKEHDEERTSSPKGGGYRHHASVITKPKRDPLATSCNQKEKSQTPDSKKAAAALPTPLLPKKLPTSSILQQSVTNSRTEEEWVKVTTTVKRRYPKGRNDPSREPEPFPYIASKKAGHSQREHHHEELKPELKNEQVDSLLPPQSSNEQGQPKREFCTFPIRRFSLENEDPTSPPKSKISKRFVLAEDMFFKKEQNSHLSSLQERLLRPFSSGLRVKVGDEFRTSWQEAQQAAGQLNPDQPQSTFSNPADNTSLVAAEPLCRRGISTKGRELEDQLMRNPHMSLPLRPIESTFPEWKKILSCPKRVYTPCSRPRAHSWKRRLPKEPVSLLGRTSDTLLPRNIRLIQGLRIRSYIVLRHKKKPKDGHLSHEIWMKWGKPGNKLSWERTGYIGSRCTTSDSFKAVRKVPQSARAWGQAQSQEGGSDASHPRPRIHSRRGTAEARPLSLLLADIPGAGEAKSPRPSAEGPLPGRPQSIAEDTKELTGTPAAEDGQEKTPGRTTGLEGSAHLHLGRAHLGSTSTLAESELSPAPSSLGAECSTDPTRLKEGVSNLEVGQEDLDQAGSDPNLMYSDPYEDPI